jgi:hypothetical protein
VRSRPADTTRRRVPVRFCPSFRARPWPTQIPSRNLARRRRQATASNPAHGGTGAVNMIIFSAPEVGLLFRAALLMRRLRRLVRLRRMAMSLLGMFGRGRIIFSVAFRRHSMGLGSILVMGSRLSVSLFRHCVSSLGWCTSQRQSSNKSCGSERTNSGAFGAASFLKRNFGYGPRCLPREPPPKRDTAENSRLLSCQLGHERALGAIEQPATKRR